ncbi:MAG: TonB dependent receptor [Bacteroidota bacterium]
MKKILTLFFTLLLFVSHMLAQNQVTGKVTDQQQQPLAFANVLLLNYADSSFVQGSITNDAGAFLMETVEAGKYFLSVSMIGYDTYQSSPFSILATENQNQNFDITLLEGSTSLAEITVVEKKPLLEQKIDRTIVNVQNSVVAAGSDVLTILERLPGIEVDRINNQIQMQGKEGVVVMLNGKMIRMDANGLVQLLSGLNSNDIQTIELITTPPASFDAEGDAGIINIKTKKILDEGFNGSLSGNIAYGLRPKFGGGFNFNYKKNKYNIFLSSTNTYTLSQEDITIFRQNNNENILTTTQIFSDRPSSTGLYNYRLGMDYELSDRSTVGFLFSGYWRTWDMYSDMFSSIENNIGEAFSTSNDAYEQNDWTHWMTNINFRHRFKDEGTLNIDFDYLEFSEQNPITYLENFMDADANTFDIRDYFSQRLTDVDFQVVKIDYAKSLSEQWSFEAGIKGALSSFINDTELANLENGAYISDPRFTDVYSLSEKLGAIYSSFEFNPNNKLSIKAGLRYEYYDSDLTAEVEGDILLQNYGRLFPSAFLSYQLSSTQKVSFSYSRRITRPSIRYVTPAFIFWGYNTVLSGNPDIRPTFSDRLNISYQHPLFLLQLQYSDDDDAITFQPTVFAEDNLIVTRTTNMPDLKTAMLSLNVPIRWNNWFESRINTSLYWFRLQPLFEGNIQTYTNWFSSSTLTNTFKLPKDFSLELVGRFNSERRIGLGTMPSRTTIDLGIKKSINSKLSMTLNWSDLFNLSSFYAINFAEPDLNVVYDWNYDAEGNLIRLSFSYNFGNTQLKGAGGRTTGSEEERGRMN